MRTLLFLFLFFIPGVIPAGAQENKHPADTAAGADGEKYNVGWFKGTSVLFGKSELVNANPAGASTDIYVIGYNAAGTLLWAHRFGGEGYDYANSVAVTPSGLVIVCGEFRSSSIVFGNGSGMNHDATGGDADFFVTALDSNGAVKWTVFAGGKEYDRATDIHIDSAGTITVTGTSLSDSVTLGNRVLYNPGGVAGIEFELKLNEAGQVLLFDEKEKEYKNLQKQFYDQFVLCLNDSKIRISCSGCEGVSVNVEITVTADGKLGTAHLNWGRTCGMQSRKKMEDCLKSYLGILNLPPALFGKTFLLKASRVLKC
jgi:hypothetical protein